MAQNLMALMIITVDESSKDGCTIFHCRGQAAYGQRATIDADFVCGEWSSILTAMGIQGYVRTHVVPEQADMKKCIKCWTLTLSWAGWPGNGSTIMSKDSGIIFVTNFLI